MNDAQNKINLAFEKHLSSSLTKQNLADIQTEFGIDTAAQVKTIYSEALNAPVKWRTATMDSALDTMHRFLTENYPWLSDKARTKINYAFIMAWK